MGTHNPAVGSLSAFSTSLILLLFYSPYRSSKTSLFEKSTCMVSVGLSMRIAVRRRLQALNRSVFRPETPKTSVTYLVKDSFNVFQIGMLKLWNDSKVNREYMSGTLPFVRSRFVKESKSMRIVRWSEKSAQHLC